MSITLLVVAFAVVAIGMLLVVSMRNRQATAGAMTAASNGAVSSGRAAAIADAPTVPARQVAVRTEPSAPPQAAIIEPEPPGIAAVSPPPEIRWCADFDSRSSSLDDRARLRLIGDLGVVAKEWCVPLLAGAYAQEQHPGHRQAALIALAACRSKAAAPTFELALVSGDANENAIAADALADLEPPAQRPARRTVERF